MAKKEVGPNVLCRVIGSSVGPSGTTVGRIVKVVDKADPPEHVVWGPMWDAIPADGQPFKVKITSPDMQSHIFRDSNNATFASDWLEPLEDDTLPPKAETTEKERDLVN